MGPAVSKRGLVSVALLLLAASATTRRLVDGSTESVSPRGTLRWATAGRDSLSFCGFGLARAEPEELSASVENMVGCGEGTGEVGGSLGLAVPSNEGSMETVLSRARASFTARLETLFKASGRPSVHSSSSMSAQAATPSLAYTSERTTLPSLLRVPSRSYKLVSVATTASSG
jgi:hypothetical protein